LQSEFAVYDGQAQSSGFDSAFSANTAQAIGIISSSQ
jgi:hypothetical protein